MRRRNRLKMIPFGSNQGHEHLFAFKLLQRLLDVKLAAVYFADKSSTWHEIVLLATGRFILFYPEKSLPYASVAGFDYD